MCDYFEWDHGDQEREEAYKAFKDALVLEFNDLYGRDVDDIESWRGLCVALEWPVPKTLSAAKEVRSLDS